MLSVALINWDGNLLQSGVSVASGSDEHCCQRWKFTMSWKIFQCCMVWWKEPDSSWVQISFSELKSNYNNFWLSICWTISFSNKLKPESVAKLMSIHLFEKVEIIAIFRWFFFACGGTFYKSWKRYSTYNTIVFWRIQKFWVWASKYVFL